MNTTAYASAHIDGELDCASLKVGILESPDKTPVVFFHVIAGVQRHPVWAIDHLAVQIYSYCQAAQHNGLHSIEINLTANLVSGNRMTCPIAAKIIWHTSGRIRGQAEAILSAMNVNAHGNGRSRGQTWSANWPSRETMKIPQTDQLS
jgi:hypothetical protein